MKKIIILLGFCLICSGMLRAANMYDYRGNKNTKVYHYRTCKFFNRLTNYEEFATTQEAENKGYRPCKICHPNLVKNEDSPNINNKIMLAHKEK